MISTLVAVVVAPLLTAAATLTSRRWGLRAGGIVSAFPAIVGPVLLVVDVQHGPAFAARAADGTLLGLVALAGFALGYGRAALRRGWAVSLAAGWAGAVVAAAAVAAVAPPTGAGTPLLVAVVALAAAFMALGAPSSDSAPAAPADAAPGRISARMAMAAVLVVALPIAAGALGPVAGGMLAALPVLASVLAVFTHRDAGGPDATVLLRGMLAGMGGFVAFCEVVALLLAGHGAALAFAAATVAALVVQAGTAMAGADQVSAGASGSAASAASRSASENSGSSSLPARNAS